tara:strand:+ start:1425 stop:1940 length:516 start_codon:yes stop_codon:yes gene_type:complete
MVETPREKLDYPIPGQGMTAEVGSRPWQNPPQYTTVEQALEFYIPRLVSDDVYESLLDSMELGIPLTIMADSMQSTAVMQGLHTIDVGILAMPVIIEMLAYIGDDAGIEYNLGMDKPIDEDKISDTKIALAMKRMREKLPQELDAREEMPEEPEAMEEDTPQPSGLMARRV